MTAPPLHPIVIWFGRVGDMILLSALLDVLAARYGGGCHVIGAGSWPGELYATHSAVARVSALHRYTAWVFDPAWWRTARALRAARADPVYVCETDPRKLARIRRLLAASGTDPRRCLILAPEPAEACSHWVDRLVSAAAPPSRAAAAGADRAVRRAARVAAARVDRRRRPSAGGGGRGVAAAAPARALRARAQHDLGRQRSRPRRRGARTAAGRHVRRALAAAVAAPERVRFAGAGSGRTAALAPSRRDLRRDGVQRLVCAGSAAARSYPSSASSAANTSSMQLRTGQRLRRCSIRARSGSASRRETAVCSMLRASSAAGSARPARTQRAMRCAWSPAIGTATQARPQASVCNSVSPPLQTTRRALLISSQSSPSGSSAVRSRRGGSRPSPGAAPVSTVL